jgi:hypothetical protein
MRDVGAQKFEGLRAGSVLSTARPEGAPFPQESLNAVFDFLLPNTRELVAYFQGTNPPRLYLPHNLMLQRIHSPPLEERNILKFLFTSAPSLNANIVENNSLIHQPCVTDLESPSPRFTI